MGGPARAAVPSPGETHSTGTSPSAGSDRRGEMRRTSGTRGAFRKGGKRGEGRGVKRDVEKERMPRQSARRSHAKRGGEGASASDGSGLDCRFASVPIGRAEGACFEGLEGTEGLVDGAADVGVVDHRGAEDAFGVDQEGGAEGVAS